MNKISRNIWILFSKLVGFNAIGSRSCVYRPMQIDNPKTITIGHRTFIGHYAWLMGSEDPQSKGLSIGNRITIGHFAHIVACKDEYYGRKVPRIRGTRIDNPRVVPLANTQG